MVSIRKVSIAFTAVAGLLAWPSSAEVSDFVPELPSVTDGWDDFTTAEPQYPPAETSQVNRDAWGYGSVVKDITGNEPLEFEITSVVDESRIPVYMDDPAYDAVGQIQVSLREYDPNLKQLVGPIEGGLCTAQYSNISQYDNISSSDVILSAGHCFDNVKPETGKRYRVVDATFIANYVDIYGQIQTFESELFMGSLEYIRPKEGQDVAIATLETPVPDNIVPVTAHVNYQFHVEQGVSAPGFSADKQGMYTDDCRIANRQVGGSWVLNNCDVQKGASGHGLVVNRGDNSLEIGAILSAFYIEGAVKNLTKHSLITSSFLDQVPFLEREKDFSPNVITSQEHWCLLVTASRLNVRSEPQVRSGNELGFLKSSNNEKPTLAYEVERAGNWSKISLDGGRIGYISNSPSYTQRVPCQ